MKSCHLLLYLPPSLMTSFMYKITAKMFEIKSKQWKQDDRFRYLTSGTPLQLYEQPFLILITSVFWPWIQENQALMVGPSPPPVTSHLTSKCHLLAYPPTLEGMTLFLYSPLPTLTNNTNISNIKNITYIANYTHIIEIDKIISNISSSTALLILPILPILPRIPIQPIYTTHLSMPKLLPSECLLYQSTSYTNISAITLPSKQTKVRRCENSVM